VQIELALERHVRDVGNVSLIVRHVRRRPACGTRP
jgi:hypothetical protein